MKLKYSIDTVNLGNEIVVVPIGADSSPINYILKVNTEGLEILTLLSEETTEDAIIENLHIKYGADCATLREYVHSFVNDLRQQQLIEG